MPYSISRKTIYSKGGGWLKLLRGASPLSKISSPSPSKERDTEESQREAKPLF